MIGRPGNVLAAQMSMLVSRPLGVKSVVNALRASGGADREDRDQARENAPIGVTALDRLVSLRDYGDFTRTFAGIAKADARRLTNGVRQFVHLTITGANDIPIGRRRTSTSTSWPRCARRAIDVPLRVQSREPSPRCRARGSSLPRPALGGGGPARRVRLRPPSARSAPAALRGGPR